MRSPLLRFEKQEDRKNYSELQVLYSNAGYYIGTIFHGEDGFDEPGSRDSQYYATKLEAEQALLNKTWKQRDNP